MIHILTRLARAFRQGRIKSRRQLRAAFLKLWIFEWSRRPAYYHPKACACCGLLALMRAEPPPKCELPPAPMPDPFDQAEARRIEVQAASARHHDYELAPVEARRVG